MKNINDIDRAFPEAVSADSMGGLNYSREKGMSLRDYFAAQALARMVGLYDIDEMTTEAPDRFAVVAYQLADAMLKARQAPASAATVRT